MRKSLLLFLLLHIAVSSFASDTIRVSKLGQLLHLEPRQTFSYGAHRRGEMQLSIENDRLEDVLVYLRAPSADSIDVFIKGAFSDKRVITGPYVNVMRWPFPEDPAIVPIGLKVGETVMLKVRLSSSPGRPFSMRNVVLQSHSFTLANSVEGFRQSIGRTEFNGFFLGATVFAMLFFLLIWAKVKQRVFLLYSLYLFGAVAYALIVKSLPYSYLTKLAYIDYPLTYKLGEPIQYLFFAAYIAFARELLDVNRQHGALHTAIQVFVVFLAGAGVVLLAYNFLNFNYLLQQVVFVWSRLIILPVAMVLIFWVIGKAKSPVKWFFVTGSSLFFLGGLLAVAVDPKSRHLFLGVTHLNPVNFFKAGILLECLCFAFALAYKIRMQQEGREQATRAYIEQLNVNQQMAASENQRLERMVAQRTAEILEKNRKIEQQEQEQIRAGLERQLVEVEMKALRSQMNPHFIFNSLNSIRYQILKQDYEQAVNYLNQFSKLLRYVLQNTRELLVSLTDEIEMNRLYVQLEKLRFGDSFEFSLCIPEDLDTDSLMVPPMLLQPYIENAVKHGLVPSAKPVRKLLVAIEHALSGYRVIIEDNGVGRASNAEPAPQSRQQLGMMIAQERIELFNRRFRPRIRVEIQDLSEGQVPCGTRVLITYQIPLS